MANEDCLFDIHPIQKTDYIPGQVCNIIGPNLARRVAKTLTAGVPTPATTTCGYEGRDLAAAGKVQPSKSAQEKNGRAGSSLIHRPVEAICPDHPDRRDYPLKVKSKGRNER